MNLNHSETFYSLQGEGTFVGKPSVFFRMSGCPLRCVWCDTPYTSWNPEKNQLDRDTAVNDILRQAYDNHCAHIVITGGEPFAQKKALASVCDELREHQGWWSSLDEYDYEIEPYITIETAGIIFKQVDADLISISPKLSNSTPTEDEKWADKHDRSRINKEVILQFLEEYPCQLKFVVDQPQDVEEIEQLLEDLVYNPLSKPNYHVMSEPMNSPRLGEALKRVHLVEDANVMLMPQGKTADEVQGKSAWLAEICKDKGYVFSPRLHVDIWGDQRGV
jgi:7-carboxy-7-deazaguanine synthase